MIGGGYFLVLFYGKFEQLYSIRSLFYAEIMNQVQQGLCTAFSPGQVYSSTSIVAGVLLHCLFPSRSSQGVAFPWKLLGCSK